jgi:beta-N-acetylhexosaminidase
LALPIVDKSRSEIEAYEISPFRSLIQQAPALMSAHIIFPAFDAERPATLSPVILQQLLRDEWHFEGVTITDGMNMKAIRERWGQARGTVMAIGAGADLSLVLGSPDEQRAARQALLDALASSELAIERLRQSKRHVDTLIQRFPSACREYSAAQETADRALFADAWARALTAIGEVKRPPLGSKVRLVIANDSASDGVSEAGLPSQVLITRLAALYQLEAVGYEQASQLNWAALPDDGHFTIVASTTRRRYGERERATWRPDLHLALWNPYTAADLPCPALISYGFAEPALDALIDFLSGKLEARGTMPGPLVD